MTIAPSRSGHFQDQKLAVRKAIPMAVLLPTGCNLFSNKISGTDIDGHREVRGVSVVHEAKSSSVGEVPRGQLESLKELSRRHDFVVLSYWCYEPLTAEHCNEAALEAKANGYVDFAVPLRAQIFCQTVKHRDWLVGYLKENSFSPVYNIDARDVKISFKSAYSFVDTHVMEPTPQWKAVAFLPDHYKAFLNSELRRAR